MYPFYVQLKFFNDGFFFLFFFLDRIRGLSGEGMPHAKHSGLRGNLYVKFQVVFPEKFELSQAGDEFYNVRKKIAHEVNNDYVNLSLSLSLARSPSSETRSIVAA